MALTIGTIPHRDSSDLLQGVGRYEFKYIIDRRSIEGVRNFVRQFCEPDPHCKGSPPKYEVTTLQLDTPFHNLGLAKERDALNRFKLRVRAYSPWNENEVKLEIKEKLNDRYFKLKSRLRPDEFDAGFLLDADQDRERHGRSPGNTNGGPTGCRWIKPRVMEPSSRACTSVRASFTAAAHQ